MADEKEPEAGEDPWAGLESEQLPDLTEGFDFSFEESGESDGASDEPPAGELSSSKSTEEDDADDQDVDEWLEEPEAPAAAPELSVFHSDDDEAGHDTDNWQAAASGPSSIDIAAEPSGITTSVSPEATAPAEPNSGGDDFGGDDAVAAAVASELFAGDSPEESAVAAAAAADVFEPGIEAADDSEDAAGNAGGMFSFTESMESHATEAEAGDEPEAAPESTDFAFAGIGASDDEQEGQDEASEGEVSSEDVSPFGEAVSLTETGIVAAASDEPKATGKKAAKPTRAAPAKKKKPSMVGQMVGMVVGGAMSIPIVLAILWWGVGKDPLKVAPMVPDSLAFILPAKLRPGGQNAVKPGLEGASSLDDVLSGSGGPEPADPGLATVEPGGAETTEPVLPVPEPVAPPESDVAVADPAPDTGTDGGGDDLTALLNEEPTVPSDPAPPPAAPEPEPLDIAALQDAADKALAAMAAVEGVNDPADPVHKKLLVECYKALAAYAQELAMLERVAVDTARNLDAMPAPVLAMHEAITGRPELFDSLARLTRNWMDYAGRSSDGIVVPAKLQSAKAMGPNCRLEVTVGERPVVVLARKEPTVAAGETVIVTGVIVGKDAVWATDIQPAKAADPFGL